MQPYSHVRKPHHAAPALLALAFGVSLAAHDREGHYVAPVKSGINKDAMTMQECRERLAAPVKDRPPSEDGIDIDAMCRNMLSASKTWTTRKPAARSVSAPSQAASR